KARVGRHAGHAEHADRGRNRTEFRVDLGQSLAVGNRVRLPACSCEYDVTLGEAGIFRIHDLAHRTAFHHPADRHRRRIGWALAHAAAHIGIKRQPDGTQENLTLARSRYRGILDAKIRRFRFTDRTRDQHDAFCGLRHWIFSDCYSRLWEERSEMTRLVRAMT